MASAVAISAIKKRAYLRQICEQAKAEVISVREKLLQRLNVVLNVTLQGGKILASTSGSGQSGSFEISVMGKEFTPDNIVALVEECLEILDTAIAAGAIDSPDPSAIDTLYAVMCDDDRLRGIRRYMGDFSGLNFPATSLR